MTRLSPAKLQALLENTDFRCGMAYAAHLLRHMGGLAAPNIDSRCCALEVTAVILAAAETFEDIAEQRIDFGEPEPGSPQ